MKDTFLSPKTANKFENKIIPVQILIIAQPAFLTDPIAITVCVFQTHDWFSTAVGLLRSLIRSNYFLELTSLVDGN